MWATEQCSKLTSFVTGTICLSARKFGQSDYMRQLESITLQNWLNYGKNVFVI